MARKKKHEEHENHERWLVSYADFITLLFAFFVVMYSISSVNEGKYRVLSDALVAAFRSPAKSMEPIQIGSPARSRHDISPDLSQKPLIPGKSPKPTFAAGAEKEGLEKGATQNISEIAGRGGVTSQELARAQTSIQKMADAIEKAMASMISQDLISVQRNELWIEVEINAKVLFTSGSADLQPDALLILQELAAILVPFTNPLRVEGFTDNRPINTLSYPSNWELSAARSARVVHLFTKAGIEPRRMAAIGYGEFHPIADNQTEEGRAQNRRVVLVILENAFAQRVYESKEMLANDEALKLPPTTPPAVTAPERQEPVDVTAQETKFGKFTIIEPPIQLPFSRP